MGRFNEIQVGRFNRALQKLLSMPGDAVAPVLATELQPNISFPLGMEFRWLDGWDRFASTIILGPTVGQTNAFRIRNPANSAMIAIIDKLTISTDTAQFLDLSVQAASIDLPN